MPVDGGFGTGNIGEIISLLENTQVITLATCSGSKVTARSMSIVNDGLLIMFQTGGNSEKARQMRKNPNVAFAAGNMQIEAVARICGHPNENQLFIDKYKAKYPQYHTSYTDSPDEVLIIAMPTKFSFYKYIDGKPCVDVLNVAENKAYREVLM